MGIIQGVFDLTEEVLNTKPSHVTINQEKIEELADVMKSTGPVKFTEQQPEYKTKALNIIYQELVAGSINYCYWYGTHDIRPVNNSSTSMYECVYKNINNDDGHVFIFENRINKLIDSLVEKRFTLLEDRKRCLRELCEDSKAKQFVHMVADGQHSGEELLYFLSKAFVGYGSDMFLKRAILFFIQIYRRLGLYEDFMNDIFVPADYQVPKILRHFECIEYSPELTYLVDNSILINKHSIMEIQIRAATIKVCKIIQNITGWNIADIDTYLWIRRKMTDQPFHITISIDY